MKSLPIKKRPIRVNEIPYKGNPKKFENYIFQPASIIIFLPAYLVNIVHKTQAKI